MRFRVYPQDHEPMHAHGFIGGGEVIVDFVADRRVRLADRDDNVRGVTASEARKVLRAAADSFDELVAEWEKMHAC